MSREYEGLCEDCGNEIGTGHTSECMYGGRG